MLDPGCLPTTFSSSLLSNPESGALGSFAHIRLDKDSAIIERGNLGATSMVVLPMDVFNGVMVHVTPGGAPGSVSAKLVLKHADDALSIVLATTDQPEKLANCWPAWSKALDLPMIVRDMDGKIKPIEVFSALPSASPAPRRKFALLTGRRPRFLVRRHIGVNPTQRIVHRDEREIIARN